MKTKTLNLSVASASKLLKAELPELQEAVRELAAVAKREVREPKSPEVAAKRVMELRLAVATQRAGEGHGTTQSLAEALLQAEVLPGVGIAYEEVLHLCREAFPESKTSMNSVRWYASKLGKRLKEEGKSLPTRPMSA